MFELPCAADRLLPTEAAGRFGRPALEEQQ